MGKVTGFLEYGRIEEPHEAKEARKKHYREFYARLSDDAAGVQGARCMDCGIPFCMSGCPVNNIIPDWNDLVYRQDWKAAIETLHSTNNFPEFTGRICPAPCEEACVLRINEDPVGIKSIEHAIIDKAWEEGWVRPQPPAHQSGKKLAVVGSGPAGLACAQQLARAGHAVTVFEKSDRIGGLLRYGIPDFKLDKRVIDRRLEQMAAEGVGFRTRVCIGKSKPGTGIPNDAAEHLPAARLLAEFDAVALCGGAEQPRDLPIPGRSLDGIHFAMEFLPLQNKRVAGDRGIPDLRDWSIATKAFVGEGGKVKALKAIRLEWQDGKPKEVAGSEFEMPADLVLLAMGFVSPVQALLDEFGVQKDARGNARAETDGARAYATSVPKLYAAGDMRRGQSLVVWAIREGRQCARAIDEFLMGFSELPR